MPTLDMNHTRTSKVSGPAYSFRLCVENSTSAFCIGLFYGPSVVMPDYEDFRILAQIPIPPFSFRHSPTDQDDGFRIFSAIGGRRGGHTVTRPMPIMFCSVFVRRASIFRLDSG